MHAASEPLLQPQSSEPPVDWYDEPAPPDFGPLVDGVRFAIRGGKLHERNAAGDFVESFTFDVPEADLEAAADTADDPLESAEGAETDAAPAEPIAEDMTDDLAQIREQIAL